MTIILEHNVETGQVAEREATKQEADFIANKAIELSELNANKQKKSLEKQTILDKLGLTNDEIETLLS